MLTSVMGHSMPALLNEHLTAAVSSLREALRARDLPALSGVSKEAAAMAAGYLERHRLGESRPDRSVTLTAAGRAAQDCGYARQAEKAIRRFELSSIDDSARTPAL
jgi:hypothetical protein